MVPQLSRDALLDLTLFSYYCNGIWAGGVKKQREVWKKDEKIGRLGLFGLK